MTLRTADAVVDGGQRIFWFDVVRGLSALAVCAGHLRAVMFCDRAEIEVTSVWQAPFYFATGLGHEAVVVFFVLSGYFVGGSVLRQRRNFQWSAYALARLSRLWTVLLPALVFTFAVDAIIAAIDPIGLAGGYERIWRSGPVAGQYASSAKAFLTNLVFLQTVSGPVFGSNGPLWSLANEFWYYVLFPLVVSVAYPRVRAASLAYVIIVASLLSWLPVSLTVLGLVWMFGVVLESCKSRQPRATSGGVAGVWASLVVFILSLVAAKIAIARQTPAFGSDFVVGASFTFLAWNLVGLAPSGRPLVQRAMSRLSDVSYSLYLFHFPPVFLVGAVILHGRQLQPTASGLLTYVALLALVCFVCAIAWFLFERNTATVRQTVARILGINRACLPRAIGPQSGSQLSA